MTNNPTRITKRLESTLSNTSIKVASDNNWKLQSYGSDLGNVIVIFDQNKNSMDPDAEYLRIPGGLARISGRNPEFPILITSQKQFQELLVTIKN